MITVFGFTFCILLHCRSAHFAYLLINTFFLFFIHNYKSRYFGDCQRGIWGLWYSKVEGQTGRHGCRWSICKSGKERWSLGAVMTTLTAPCRLSLPPPSTGTGTC